MPQLWLTVCAPFQEVICVLSGSTGDSRLNNDLTVGGCKRWGEPGKCPWARDSAILFTCVDEGHLWNPVWRGECGEYRRHRKGARLKIASQYEGHDNIYRSQSPRYCIANNKLPQSHSVHDSDFNISMFSKTLPSNATLHYIAFTLEPWVPSQVGHIYEFVFLSWTCCIPWVNSYQQFVVFNIHSNRGSPHHFARKTQFHGLLFSVVCRIVMITDSEWLLSNTDIIMGDQEKCNLRLPNTDTILGDQGKCNLRLPNTDTILGDQGKCNPGG
jgi:hypothetical protein